MRLSDKEFFEDKLDLSIPQLKRAAELFKSGDTSAACDEFANYLRGALNREVLFSRPFFPQEKLPKNVSAEQYADMILEGYVYSVGFLYKFEGGRIIWDHNPTYNGYVEFGFHLNYNSEFYHLGKRYSETGDEKYARRYAEMISSWLMQTECPGKIVGDGARPCWRSIETANRMYGCWPRAICFFIDSPSVSNRLWVDIFKSIWEHSYRLVGLETKFNWHTTEIHGMIYSALLYPFFREAEEWYGWCIEELKKQFVMEFYPDGMQAELCTGYQFGVISHFRSIEYMIEKFGREVPAELYDGYRLLLSGYFKLADPTGTVTANNDSRAIGIKEVAQRALDIFPNDPFYTWFLTDGKEGVGPDYTSILLPYSGLGIIRTGWEKDDIWAMLDSGPEGTAHIHEDKLNFVLTAYGERMLEDIGFYAYDTSDMRYFVVGTRSHNSGLVDGFGQNRTATHKWGKGIDYLHTQTPAYGEYADVNALSDIGYSASEDYEILSGTYSGDYGPELIKAEHKRRAVFFKKGLGNMKPFFLLLDSFRSLDGEERSFEVSFQHKAIPMTVDGRVAVAHFPDGQTLHTVSTVYPSLLCGQYTPRYVGWRPIHDPKEHEHIPAPFLTFTKRGGSAEFATLLYPSPDSSAPKMQVELCEGEIKITVDGEIYSFDPEALR